MADVEMKDNVEVEGKDGQQKSKEPKNLALNEIRNNIALIEKSVASKEARMVARALRYTSGLRKKLSSPVLTRIINQYFPSEAPEKEALLGFLKHVPVASAATTESKTELMDTSVDASKQRKAKSAITPEVEVYVHLLVVLLLLDNKLYDQAMQCSSSLVERVEFFNRRTMDLLAAKSYYYFSLSFEEAGRLSDIRSKLLAAHRTVILRHDEPSQAMLTTLLLRNYLAYSLFDQADKFRLKTTFPEAGSNNLYARYLYYISQILSVQLQYSSAYTHLMQALRKAPQSTAVGFRLTVQKLAIIVQLLMGEIPERSIFYQAQLSKALRPYLMLTQAVRVGDLAAFMDVMEKHANTFIADKTYNLIVRLRHNVIKTGLRKINLAYSRVSLQDIATKLHLDAPEDTECIVAKAIHDGVIDSLIDHNKGFAHSRENLDVYSTDEPQAAFHKRITFCLDIHNEAIKALRFPPDAHKMQLESPEARRERLEQEQQLALDLVEDDDADF